MPKYYCMESTVEVERDGFLIRVWIGESVAPQFRYELVYTLRDLIQSYDVDQIGEALTNLPNINAFQICWLTQPGVRVGTMYYTVPFSEEV